MALLRADSASVFVVDAKVCEGVDFVADVADDAKATETVRAARGL